MATSTPTVVFITGVGRGLGEGLLRAYISRPNYIVIGSVRDASSSKYDNLKSTPSGPGSRLLLVSIESTSSTEAKKAVEEIQHAGINHIDIVVANAGFSPDFTPPETMDAGIVTETFQINSVGPLLLFQATKPLLDRSSRPTWLSMSSVVSSISSVEPQGYSTLLSYGASKAALNWITQAIRSANPTWAVLTVHPGWVQTDMGNAGAKGFGLEEAPDTLADSMDKVVSFLDNATRDTPGYVVNLMTGEQVPY